MLFHSGRSNTIEPTTSSLYPPISNNLYGVSNPCLKHGWTPKRPFSSHVSSPNDHKVALILDLGARSFKLRHKEVYWGSHWTSALARGHSSCTGSWAIIYVHRGFIRGSRIFQETKRTDLVFTTLARMATQCCSKQRTQLFERVSHASVQ